VTALLHRLLTASVDPQVRPEDALAFAVTEYANTLRASDPAAVTPAMITAAEMLARGAAALSDAAKAARQELDTELDALGADEVTGLVEGQAVYVTGADGTRYQLTRGHIITKVFDDATIIRLIATALRATWRPPAGTPGFLAGPLGDAYEAGVADGAAKARQVISRSTGRWKSTELEPLARTLAKAGDLFGGGLLAAARREDKIDKRPVAQFTVIKPRT